MSFFGKNIKKIRSVKHMSQLDFAALFDLKRGTLGAYEEGRSEPKIDTIIKVSQYFNVSTDQLLTGELTVNQLLNFSNDLHDGISQKADSNNISIPLLCNANIHSISTDSWDESTLSSTSLVQVPLDSSISIAFQHDSHISKQYTAMPLAQGDILFASEQDKSANSTVPSTFVVLYMKQLLLVDGTIENGQIISSLAPPIDTKDCLKVWKVAAHLNAAYTPQNSDTIYGRLNALEREMRLLKK